jgi:hypothetical protein
MRPGQLFARTKRGNRSKYTVRLGLEALEDRTLPSASMLGSMMAPSPQPTASATATNAIAALSHDQIHTLQDQAQQQATIATLTLQVEQFVLSVLKPFAAQFPQVKPFLNALSNAIPMQQARATQLQNQSNALDQLDSLQDQVILLDGEIQNDSMLVPVLQQIGAVQVANGLLHKISQDQLAVQALQPQITGAEQVVAALLGG